MLSVGRLVEGTPYRVLRELGAGGMGVVYEVEHIRLGKRYVAKIIRASFQGATDAMARIEREARVLAELNHPNIVQIHDVGSTSEGLRYLVMELLEGSDLRERMTSGPRLEPAAALGIVASVLEALAYVHQRGIVHRDIKPANIFLADAATGVVTKVLDFGIAHVAVDTNALTKTGAFLGTLEYASPEQMHGQPPGPATDVYAAGLVLFELIAGHGPFASDPGVGVTRCFKPAPTLASVINVAPGLSDIVAAALSIEPVARPTAAEFAAMLHALRATPHALVRVPTAESVSVDDLLNNLSGPRPAVLRSTVPRRGVRVTGPQLPPAVAPTAPYWPGAIEGDRVVTGGGVASTVPQRKRSTSSTIAVVTIALATLVAVLVVAGVLHLRGATSTVGARVEPNVPASAPLPGAVPSPVASAESTPAAVAPKASAAIAASPAVITEAEATASARLAPSARPAPVAVPRPTRPPEPPKVPAKDGYITTLPP